MKTTSDVGQTQTEISLSGSSLNIAFDSQLQNTYPSALLISFLAPSSLEQGGRNETDAF